MGRRLGLMPWLGTSLLTVAVQVALLVAVAPQAVWMALAGVFLLQVAKIPPAAWRLNDLGRPPDDAMLALIPLGNLGLWRTLLAATPSDAVRERNMAAWRGASLASSLFVRGLSDLAAAPAAAAVTVLGFAVVYSLGELALVELLLSVQGRDPASVQAAVQGLWGLSAFLLAYLVVQVLKRKTASRASWFPAFFLIPVALAAGTLQIAAQQALVPPRPDDPLGGLMPVMLASSVWTIGWSCIGGALLGVAWVTIAHASHRGTTASPGDVLGQVFRRGIDVSAPHGAASLIIQLGMQVILPGIYYALSYAFVDAAAVLEPERNALRRSRAVGQGIRRRIVKVYLLGMLVALGLGMALALPTELALLGGTVPAGDVLTRVLVGVPTILFLFPVHASGLQPITLLPVSIASMFAWGISRTALVHLFHERSAEIAAAQAGLLPSAAPPGSSGGA